jgi:hypothetical protein
MESVSESRDEKVGNLTKSDRRAGTYLAITIESYNAHQIWNERCLLVTMRKAIKKGCAIAAQEEARWEPLGRTHHVVGEIGNLAAVRNKKALRLER